MTDPLSIAASVAGLALLARDIAKGIQQVRSTLKGSGDELSGLYNGVVSLYSILQGTNLVMEQMDDQLLRDTAPGDIVFACNDTFDAINRLLKKHRLDLHGGFARSERNMSYSVSAKAVGRWDTVKQATRWYFDKEEVAKLCEDLERHKSRLALAMSKDSMTALVEVLKTQTTMSRHLNDLTKVQAEIRAGQIQESKRQLSEKQTKMMKAFSDIEPREALERHLQLRQQGTGTWFLEGKHFQDFLSEDHTSLWLYGIPGAGKSVLSAAAIEYINTLRAQNVATALFFCEHDNSDTQGARSILGSFARQLANQNEDAFAELEEFYDKHTSFDKFTADGRSILHLIRSISRKFDTTFIVVDGLDECLKDRTETVQILAELSNSDNCSVKVLLTSRDERDIRSHLTEFQIFEVNAPKSDVRLHVAAQLESPRFGSIGTSNSGLKNEILEYLVEHSGGMFQWVKCQLDYLASLPSNGKRRKALKQLPPNLPQTYERILHRANETAHGDIVLYLERTLRCIAFAARPLSVTEVSHAIAIEQNDTVFDGPMDMGKILCHYDSLIKEENGVLTFSHFSIKEYLRSIGSDAGPLARFQLNENRSHEYLAETCLTYLLLEEFDKELAQSEEEVQGVVKDSQFYSYASLNWTYHARNPVESSSRVPSLVERLFEPQKTNQFVLWAYSWIRHYISLKNPGQLHFKMAAISPLHLACLCGLYDVIDTLILRGQDVNQSSSVLGTPLLCINGKVLLSSQEKGLPRPEDRQKAAERLLQENVTQDLSASFAVNGAIFHDDARLLVMLAEAGCPLTASNVRFAADKGSPSILLALQQIMRKQDLDPASDLLGALDHVKSGTYPLNRPSTPNINSIYLEHDYKEMMVSAARNGQLSRIKQILSGMQDFTGKKREKFLSELLLESSHFGHTEVVEYLLSEGADMSYKGLAREGTALHHAAHDRRTRVVQKLLNFSHDLPRSVEVEDNEGFTPWAVAIQVGSVEILQMFLEVHPSLSLDKTTKDGTTAVHLAIKSRNRSMFWFLHKRGLDITRAATDGETPLHTLLRLGYGTLELPGQFARLVIDTFLPKQDNVCSQGTMGDSILHMLFQNASQEASRSIWQAVASDSRFKLSRTMALQTRNKLDLTPLHILMQKCANMLTSSPGNHTIEMIQSICSTEEVKACFAIRDGEGRTPLLYLASLLAEREFPTAIPQSQSAMLAEAFRMLIEADEQGHCLERQDHQGRTVLHWIADCATGFPFQQIAELVLQYPVDVSARDCQGLTPLQIASSIGSSHNVDLLRCLMENTSKLDLETPVHPGGSILHRICGTKKNGIEDLLSLYLSDIATSASRDVSGRIPLMLTPLVISTSSLTYQLIGMAKGNVEVRDNDGHDLLYHSCWIGSTVMTEALISRGVKIDEPRGMEGFEEPPLLTAAMKGKSDVVKLLLDSGADPYVQDFAGARLHHIALSTRCSHLLDILEPLEGYDYNETITQGWLLSYHKKKDKKVEIFLPKAGALHIAAGNTDSQALRWLLRPERRPQNIDQETATGETALFPAAFLGVLDNCKILVSAGANVSKTRKDGCTAFDVACNHGRSQVCKFLLSVDEALAFATPISGTPLEVAVRGGHKDVVRLLLAKDVEIPVCLEMDALEAGRNDIAELLRSKLRSKSRHDIGFDTRTQKELNTLQLGRACREENDEDLLRLVRAGVSPNRRVNEGLQTALHIASGKGWEKAVEALVAGDAEVDALDNNGETPLMHAVTKRRWDVAKTLHTLGARLDHSGIDGYSVIHLVAGNPEMLAYFLENGLDATASSNIGVTALMLTANGHCVEMLLRNGCDPFAITTLCSSAVMSKSGWLASGEILQSILSERPVKRMLDIIDLRDLEWNATPLYNAAFCGMVENVLVLMDYGADVNLPGGRFGTPYQAAFKQRHVKVLTLLAENGAKPCMVVRNGQEHAAWFWEHGGQFSFPASNGTWVPTSLPLESKNPPQRIRANDARKGRYWEHGYRFSCQAWSGAWILA